MLNFTVLTLFPEMIADTLSHSVIGRAVKEGKIGVKAVDIRDFAENKHRQADDYPYGGGPGMVMTAEPVYKAYLSVSGTNIKQRVLLMSPKGKRFSQSMANELSLETDIIIICGHYEGIDERIIDLIKPECVSVGDYVLSGGEIAAMAVIDAAARLVPGVLGNESSGGEESFTDNLLEYPQYTRPREYMGLKVPDVLLSGDHAKIKAWRAEKSLEVTKANRPDMLGRSRTQSSRTQNEDLVFVAPSLEMKEAALAFRDEFINENSKMNGSANFLKYENYEAWLSDLSLIEKGEMEGRLPSSILFAVGKNSGEIIGIADIRHKISDDPNHLPSYVNGHLGGSVRPSKRGMGYAQALLRLSLTKCAAYGNRRILVSCDKNNPASEHVLRKCGGVFDNEVVEQNGNIIRRFWFYV